MGHRLAPQLPGTTPDTTSLDTRDAVAGKGKRKRRKRTTNATAVRCERAVERENSAEAIVDRIDKAASARLVVPASLARPERPAPSRRAREADTAKLYEKLREARRGDPGDPFMGHSASYVSPPTRAPKPWRGEHS